MTTMTIRARFDGTAFVPLDHVNLAAGDVADLDVRSGPVAEGDLPLGSPALTLRTLRNLPPLDGETREAFDEFERVLAEADAERKAAAIRERSEPGIYDEPA